MSVSHTRRPAAESEHSPTSNLTLAVGMLHPGLPQCGARNFQSTLPLPRVGYAAGVKRVSIAISIVLVSLSLAGCYQAPTVAAPTPEGSSTALGIQDPPVTDPQQAACRTAMSEAADVPLSRTNDAEFQVTVKACSTVLDWSEALVSYPSALGMTSVTHADAERGVALVCSSTVMDVINSPVCVDAQALGLLN